jgi:hypothetical protein
METKNSTIHIFGYGETQINSEDLSIKVSTESLVKALPLVEAIWGKRPEEVTGEIIEYHAINIFNEKDIKWQSKSNSFEIESDENISLLISELITELRERANTEPQTDKAKAPEKLKGE